MKSNKNLNYLSKEDKGSDKFDGPKEHSKE